MTDNDNDEYAMDFEDVEDANSRQEPAFTPKVASNDSNKHKNAKSREDKEEQYCSDAALLFSFSNQKQSDRHKNGHHSKNYTQTDIDEQDVVSLENFNPLDPKKRIRSPRSLKICQINGILAARLFHTSYEEIKSIKMWFNHKIGATHPQKRTDAEYLRMKYIETENQRQRLVEHLRAMRRVLIDSRTPSHFHGTPLSRPYGPDLGKQSNSLITTYMNNVLDSTKKKGSHGIHVYPPLYLIEICGRRTCTGQKPN